MLNEMHLMAREGTIDKYVFLVSSTLISFSVQLANNAHRKRYRCENPETTAVSGFSSAIFQSEIQKISFHKNDLWGGLELNFTNISERR